jgi:hypothetical protein
VNYVSLLFYWVSPNYVMSFFFLDGSHHSRPPITNLISILSPGLMRSWKDCWSRNALFTFIDYFFTVVLLQPRWHQKDSARPVKRFQLRVFKITWHNKNLPRLK